MPVLDMYITCHMKTNNITDIHYVYIHECIEHAYIPITYLLYTIYIHLILLYDFLTFEKPR